MKTTEEIISYLEEEMAEAYAVYEEAKAHNKQQALEVIIKVTLIEQILDAIKS